MSQLANRPLQCIVCQGNLVHPQYGMYLCTNCGGRDTPEHPSDAPVDVERLARVAADTAKELNYALDLLADIQGTVGQTLEDDPGLLDEINDRIVESLQGTAAGYPYPE